MSYVKDVNASLYRKIKSGNQFDKYFSNNKKDTIVFLGNGLTSFGLEQMKNWTKQHSFQTKKIAKKLKQNSLPKTVKSIHNFLYDHIQYSADSERQNLRSPNRSWIERKEGIDCKSYSIFAGSILSNLNIPFKFRKITQPSNPQRWSHVFIIVPHQGKELIIDATIPFHKKATAVKKEDLNMEQHLQYYGLNGVETSLSKKEKTIELYEAIQEFKLFLAILRAEGVSKQITSEILLQVRNSIENGVEPTIEIDNNYIAVNGVQFDLHNGLNAAFLAPVAGLFKGGKVAGFLKSNGGKAITGLLSGLFKGGNSKRDIDTSNTTHVEPMIQKVKSETSRMNASNAAQIITNLDKYINWYIRLVGDNKLRSKRMRKKQAHEKKQLTKVLTELRTNYAPYFNIRTSSSNITDKSFQNKTYTKNSVSYNTYVLKQGAIPKNKAVKTTIINPHANGNNNSAFGNLVNELSKPVNHNPNNGFGNNLPQSRQFTSQNQQQVQQQIQQPEKESSNTNYWVIGGVSLAVLGTTAVVLKKKNII